MLQWYAEVKKVKKITKLILGTIVAATLAVSASAATHTVAKGDTLWKIAVKYEVGLSEIKSANTHIKNYDLIYPGQTINIPSTDASVLAYEQEVIRLVNEIRAQNGLKALTYDWELSRVARYKSQDMKDNNYFSHTSPVYGSPFTMIKNFGISYRSAGENIAKGYSTPQAVVNGWMNSSGHRANILGSSYTHIGVGYVASGNYWTQMFISK
ncbi:MAG: SafA/ExsA family spore coat assembly protein [Clostridia bacterium]|nr:SafA/ExsA family spore coat assembly protein [Clostridia bacterium]